MILKENLINFMVLYFFV